MVRLFVVSWAGKLGGIDYRRPSQSTLPIYRQHPAVRVAIANCHAARRYLVDPRHVGDRELHLQRADVFLEILHPLGARNRHHIVALIAKSRGQTALLSINSNAWTQETTL